MSQRAARESEGGSGEARERWGAACPHVCDVRDVPAAQVAVEGACVLKHALPTETRTSVSGGLSWRVRGEAGGSRRGGARGDACAARERADWLMKPFH